MEDYRDQLINVNKKMVRSEDELIDDFIGRYGWNMNKTGTGLRYMIYSEGKGSAANPGMRAILTCSVGPSEWRHLLFLSGKILHYWEG